VTSERAPSREGRRPQQAGEPRAVGAARSARASPFPSRAVRRSGIPAGDRAVAPRGQRVARRRPLEVGANHVVEQQVVRQGEGLPQALTQVLLDRCLVRQESIQRAVEPMVIDPLGRDPQQVLERGRPIPVLGDVQLARGLTQPGDHLG